MSESATRWARRLAAAVGVMDAATGIGLMVVPLQTLGLMQATVEEPPPFVLIRFVGGFVAAVGAVYLLAVVQGGAARLRHLLESTALIRLTIAAFTAVAVAAGWLGPAWLSVTATDATVAGLQVILLLKGAGEP